MNTYELIDVSRRYGAGETAVRAVDAVSLTVARGEFLVVAGPSGSGKTTLLQLLGALDRASSGTVRFEGEDLGRMGDSALAALRRDRLGFVFQQFNLIPTLTARQNVEAAMAPTGRSGTERHRRSLELLERVGLRHRVRNLPSQLSGGEQQRVAIARALANDPDVVLADEPTGNLDSTTGDEIIGLLAQLNETGPTLVLVTHAPAIADTAGRVVRMRDGGLETGETVAAHDVTT
jgi:ABC-type lipoprotein export system ATPase subunit